MKEIKHYVCEICGIEYAEKSKAQRCEKSHKSCAKIVKAYYKPYTMNTKGHPYKIDVQLIDGTIKTYRE